MTEKSLLSPSEAQELSSYQHDSAKSTALVRIMFTKTGDAGLSLIEALKAIPGQEYIATRLTQGTEYRQNELRQMCHEYLMHVFLKFRAHRGCT